MPRFRHPRPRYRKPSFAIDVGYPVHAEPRLFDILGEPDVKEPTTGAKTFARRAIWYTSDEATAQQAAWKIATAGRALHRASTTGAFVESWSVDLGGPADSVVTVVNLDRFAERRGEPARQRLYPTGSKQK